MNNWERNIFRRSLSLTLFIALSILGVFSAGVQAQNKSIYTNKKNLVTFDPPQGDKPQQTVGGASRGNQCPINSQDLDLPLTPLLPATSPALTLKSHPTLLVYVPESSATTAFLAVRDEAENYDYQTIVPMGDRSGIVSLTLPEDAPALEVNREYQWSLILMCDGKLRPDSPVTQGNIKRVASSAYLNQKIPHTNLLESAAVYGKAGIWYDTASTLAQLKATQPDDDNIAANWENLLQTVGLESVAKADFIE